MKRILLCVLTLLILIGVNSVKVSAETTKETVFITYMIEDTVYKVEEVEKGSKVVLTDPEPLQGYEFVGWEISEKDVDLNNLTKSICVKQKWKRLKTQTPTNKEAFEEQEQQINKENNDYNEALNRYKSITKSSPKLKYNKKKNTLSINTDKKVTNVNILYSTNKKFTKYKVIKSKVKNGKAKVKLKKLKKNKTYYIKAIGYVEYSYDSQLLQETTKMSKAKRVIRKK